VKKTHSAILRKREAEVATRLSPSWNGQARKTVLLSDGISYEVSEKIRAVSYGGLGCGVEPDVANGCAMIPPLRLEMNSLHRNGRPAHIARPPR